MNESLTPIRNKIVYAFLLKKNVNGVHGGSFVGANIFAWVKSPSGVKDFRILINSMIKLKEFCTKCICRSTVISFIDE